MLTLVSRLDTTAHDSLMHPICTHDPSVPVASCLLRPGPSTRLCKAVLHESVCPSPRATCQAWRPGTVCPVWHPCQARPVAWRAVVPEAADV